jgi:hypothetical protein
MARQTWVTVRKKQCELLGRQVELKELRVYPADNLPDGIGYQVLARKCSAAIVCNLVGFPCQLAYTNPGCDRMALSGKSA